MRFLDFLKAPDINMGVKEYHATSGGVLLDVRTPQEYRAGHISGSVNVPLQSLEDVQEVVEDRNAPIFVYCRSGNRSSQAAEILGGMGYGNVKNIGGITAWSGQVECGDN